MEQIRRRRRCAPLSLVGIAILASSAGAQSAPAATGRTVETYRASDPEGRLIDFYSAATTFSALGAPPRGAPWVVGLEATYLPYLSAERRRPGIDKPESTNLSPVLPRPRLAVRAPAEIVIEGSWVPPLRIGDARANLLSVALSRAFAAPRGLTVSPRISATTGRIRGAITCNERFVESGGPDLAVYYASVCRNTASDDYFEPRQLTGELVAASTGVPWRGEAYLVAGARLDRTRFDIGVRNVDGTRDLDHPIIKLRDTRGHLAAGARWSMVAGLVSGVEWFYAPGSLSTVRALVAWRGGR